MLELLSEQSLRVNSVIIESDFSLNQQNKKLLVIKTCKYYGTCTLEFKSVLSDTILSFYIIKLRRNYQITL